MCKKLAEPRRGIEILRLCVATWMCWRATAMETHDANDLATQASSSKISSSSTAVRLRGPPPSRFGMRCRSKLRSSQRKNTAGSFSYENLAAFGSRFHLSAICVALASHSSHSGHSALFCESAEAPAIRDAIDAAVIAIDSNRVRGNCHGSISRFDGPPRPTVH
eukprot:SAG11_NODE_1177_length_5600_cov_2.043447_7_plen_164_part_00